MPLCAQAIPAERQVQCIRNALCALNTLLIIDNVDANTLLIIDNVDAIETFWAGGELHLLLGIGGLSGLGQTRCLVTSRAATQATKLGMRFKCITLTLADNAEVVDKMLRRASGDAHSKLDPAFQVRLS
jgi:hypothetical protein